MRFRVAYLVLACAIGLVPVVVSPAFGASFSAIFVPDVANTNLVAALSLDGAPVGTGQLIPSGGGLTADITQTGTAPPATLLANLNGTVSVQDFPIGTDGITVTGAALTIGPLGGPFVTDGLNPGTVNLSGLSITITQGLVMAGQIQIYDYSAHPQEFTLPASTIANFTETGGPGTYSLALSVPIDAEGTQTVPDLGTIGYVVSGPMAFTGTLIVPEPTTWALGCLGALGAIPVLRRRRPKVNC